MKKTRIIAVMLCCLTFSSSMLLTGCDKVADDSTISSSEQSAYLTESDSSQDESGMDSLGSETASAESEASASETEAPTDAPTEPPTDPEPIGNSVDWEKLQQEMQKKSDSFISGNLDSFQFAVMDAGEIVVSGVSGKHDRSNRQSLTTETVYGVASCSKVVATAAVMHLVDQGKVDLDAPVTTYIPDFTMADDRYQQITVRMLLNHSSGFLGNTMADAWKLGTFGDTTAHDKFLERLSTQRLKSDPGAYSVYCNDGFTLAEILCERVSGKSYAEYLHDEIFVPLGMEHTFTPQDTFDTTQIAAIYEGSQELPSLTTDPAQGGIFSTAEDLCRLGKAFTNAGTSVLSQASAEAAAAPEYQKGIWCEPGYSTMNYGLGWDAVDLYPFSEMGIKSVTKNGDVIYSGSQMIVLPEYNLVAAADGAGSGNGVAKGFLTYYLLRILQEKGIIDKLPEKPALTQTAGSVTDDIRAFAGTYVRSWGAYDLSFSGNSLVKTALPSGDKTTYRYIGNGHFADDSGTEYWFFEQNGRQFHVSRAWDNNTGLIDLPNVMIQGAKTEKPQLSSEAADAWRKRAGKSYVLVSEPYDSLGYVYPSYGLALPGFQLKLTMNPDVSPFWRGLLITGPDTAKNVAEVPITAGPNSVDLTITADEGFEVIHLTSGVAYRSVWDIPALDEASEITVSGEAQWFKTSSAKQLSYEIPEGCAIAVYTSDLKTAGNTHISGTDTVSTQAGGYIAFIGNGTFRRK